MESSVASGCRSATASSNAREPPEMRTRVLRDLWLRRQRHQAGELESVGLGDLSRRVGDPFRCHPGADAGEVDLEERRDRPADRGRPGGESPHGPSRDDRLDHVGELGDVRRGPALEGTDEVPHGPGDGRTLRSELLHVVLPDVADPGVDDPTHALRRDRLRRGDEPNGARPAAGSFGRDGHVLADRREVREDHVPRHRHPPNVAAGRRWSGITAERDPRADTERGRGLRPEAGEGRLSNFIDPAPRRTGGRTA